MSTATIPVSAVYSGYKWTIKHSGRLSVACLEQEICSFSQRNTGFPPRIQLMEKSSPAEATAIHATGKGPMHTDILIQFY